ncbi:hypothetical protein KBB05_04035 [Patescibacteria group bacterium]|jgi:hypothetical protein|nr:hypothetical protein [Patescibacteria group bacterium]
MILEKKVIDFSGQELKIVLLSDFDITALTRNRILENCFYIDPLHESLIADIATYIHQHFTKETSKDDQNIYEFIDQVRDIYTAKYPTV